jgi:outer membrane immunogenic protein
MTILRRSLLALAVSVGMVAGANLAAADGPGKRRDWPGDAWSWQGVYGGFHLGTADVDSDDGLVGGVQLGRNWRSGDIIYGLEGDLSLSDTDFVDWMATVRGRLGYLVSPSILVYGTAGLGLLEFDDGGRGRSDDSDLEFVYGLGVEGKLTQSTTLRLEYLGFSDTDIDVIRLGLNFKLNW